MLDVVCYYADFGRPYLPLIERMCASVREVMPDARLVLLTPTPKDELSAPFDTTAPLDIETTHANLCRERARAVCSWAMSAERPAVFVDPDVEFVKAPDLGRYDVGLLWRTNKPDQPVNTGLIVAQPGQRDFWWRYGSVAVNLPKVVHYWWCDQLAFALLTGVCHQAGETLLIEGARVRLLDAASTCAPPDEATPEAWAHHYKGKLKGPGWENVFIKSGDGKSSPGSASSTDSAAARS